MIRFKLGAPAIAQETITQYLTATMEATLAPPPAPSQKLRDAMTEMADVALAAYRNVVVDEHHFVEFFRTLTPAEELGTLALGSRPSRPSGTEDISSLRAIPWVFAWTQVRLMLPAWLGTDAALKSMSADLYAEMADWPFFHMQMDTLEMVLAKTDVVLSEFYAKRLTPQKYRPLEQNLRSSIEGLINVFLALKGSSQLLADEPETRDTLMVRNTYLDPLHLLQAELLERLRDGGQDEVAQALKVTMAGIASGLRDTG